MKNKPFKTKDELKEFINMNVPVLMKHLRADREIYIDIFTSEKALYCAVDGLTDTLWNKLNNYDASKRKSNRVSR